LVDTASYGNKTSVNFASQYVYDKFDEIILKRNDQKRYEFMDMIQNTPTARGMLGHMFEQHGHDTLKKGGKFHIKLLPEDGRAIQTIESELEIPALDYAFWSSFNVSEIYDKYALPTSKSWASVDSLWFDRSSHVLHMFQYTLSKEHGYNAEGLRRVITAIRDIDPTCAFKLYLVVPPEVYESVKFQKYKYPKSKNVSSAQESDGRSESTKLESIDEKDNEALRELLLCITQYKLKLSFNKDKKDKKKRATSAEVKKKPGKRNSAKKTSRA
jgi:hypothetical protein